MAQIFTKSGEMVPNLYQQAEFITIDEKRKHLKQRREVLELKSHMRSNAVKDLEAAKRSGIARATQQFEEKNGMARQRNTKLIADLEQAKQEFRVVSANAVSIVMW